MGNATFISIRTNICAPLSEGNSPVANEAPAESILVTHVELVFWFFFSIWGFMSYIFSYNPCGIQQRVNE